MSMAVVAAATVHAGLWIGVAGHWHLVSPGMLRVADYLLCVAVVPPRVSVR